MLVIDDLMRTDAKGRGADGMLSGILFGSTDPRGGRREGVVEAAAGREILRGVLGSIFGGGRRR